MVTDLFANVLNNDVIDNLTDKQVDAINAMFEKPRPRFHNLDEIKRANIAADGHWFSAETLRFFGSRVLPTLYGGRYFVTSEYVGFDRTDRAYTVREAQESGNITTVGEFLEHPTRESAIAAIRTLTREG